MIRCSKENHLEIEIVTDPVMPITAECRLGLESSEMIRKSVASVNEIEVGIETDPAVCADIAARHERCQQNWRWLEANAERVYSHRGKYICIAGQELFVAEVPEDALGDAEAAHPDDDGRFVLFIPKDTVPRIYAC